MRAILVQKVNVQTLSLCLMSKYDVVWLYLYYSSAVLYGIRTVSVKGSEEATGRCLLLCLALSEGDSIQTVTGLLVTD